MGTAPLLVDGRVWFGGGWSLCLVEDGRRILVWFEGVLFSTENNRVSSGNFLQNMHPLVKLLG